MNILPKKPIITGLLVSLITLSGQAFAEECNAPSSPIIPDGNVASLDELKAAQGAFTQMQDNFFVFRECINAKIDTLDTESETFEQEKAALTAKDDVAFASLNAVADNLNAAIRVYKDK